MGLAVGSGSQKVRTQRQAARIAEEQRLSLIHISSSLFSLEKDEVFPYERFAYNLLDIAIEALNAKGLPERVIIRCV